MSVERRFAEMAQAGQGVASAASTLNNWTETVRKRLVTAGTEERAEQRRLIDACNASLSAVERLPDQIRKGSEDINDTIHQQTVALQTSIKTIQVATAEGASKLSTDSQGLLAQTQSADDHRQNEHDRRADDLQCVLKVRQDQANSAQQLAGDDQVLHKALAAESEALETARKHGSDREKGLQLVADLTRLAARGCQPQLRDWQALATTLPLVLTTELGTAAARAVEGNEPAAMLAAVLSQTAPTRCRNWLAAASFSSEQYADMLAHLSAVSDGGTVGAILHPTGAGGPDRAG